MENDKNKKNKKENRKNDVNILYESSQQLKAK
jgi:hypothetical protein